MQVIELKCENGGWSGEARVAFPRSEKVFEGHFPYAPILPGVALIDGAVRIVSQATGLPLRLRGVSSVKFTNVVLPDQTVVFTFKAIPDMNDEFTIKLSGHWVREADKIADLQATLVNERTKGGSHAS